MSLLMGLLIFSFIITSLAIVPFINTLYRIKFQRKAQQTTDAFGQRTPIFDKFHKGKAGTPVGGGLLVITVVTLMFFLLFPLVGYLGVNITHVHQSLTDQLNIIFFTFISFGLLGLYDDVMKMFRLQDKNIFGLRMRHKFIIEWILALIVACLLHFNLAIDFIYLPVVGSIHLGLWYIPLASFVIVSFTNAVNITDGLDGLSAGVLMISLVAFWFLSASILDTPLSMFIALWIGSLIAFLYFNVYPARIFLGDVGALSFGATFAVIGLLLGKVVGMAIIGGVFVFEISSSLIQLMSKKLTGKKVFQAAPFHLLLQQMGWPEPKIVMRFWLASIILSAFGVWLALIQP